MTFARSVRNTPTERALILRGTIPGSAAMMPLNVLPLALGRVAAHPAQPGSFPQFPLSCFHSLSLAPTVFRIRKMITANQVLSRAQSRLAALIEHEKQVCGSAVTAVKVVARRIGASPAWVRKITGRYGEATVQAHKFLNIIREHVRVSKAKRRAAKHARIFSSENRSKAELSA